MSIDLDALEALIADATPAPWVADHAIVRHPDADGPAVGQEIWLAWVGRDTVHANARLVAAARTALPELIAEVRRLRRIADLTQAFLDEFGPQDFAEWSPSLRRKHNKLLLAMGQAY